MSTLSITQMDTLTISCLATAAGALPAQLLPMAVRIAGAQAPRSTLPMEVAKRLCDLGLQAHAAVWNTSRLASAFGSLTKRCRWALVWMEPDADHDTRWWSILHTCEDGKHSLTHLIHADPDLCDCGSIDAGWSGHAVVLDWIPASSILRQPGVAYA